MDLSRKRTGPELISQNQKRRQNNTTSRQNRTWSKKEEQSHTQAKQWNRRPFPFYDSLAIVYGKDYTSGGGAEDMADAMHDIDVEDNVDQIHSLVVDLTPHIDIVVDQACPCIDELIQSSPRLAGNATDTPPQVSQHEGGSSRSRRQRLESSIHGQLDKLGTLFEASLNKSVALTDCLSVEKDIHDKRARVEAKLAKIEELFDVDRIRMGGKLVQDPADLQFFFSQIYNFSSRFRII